MQNGQKTMMSTHRPKSARPFANRSKQWTSNVAPPIREALETLADLEGPCFISRTVTHRRVDRRYS